MLQLEQPKHRWRIVLAVLLLVLVVVAYGHGTSFSARWTLTMLPPSITWQHGSIGAEGQQGMPLWIFVVLPRLFPEYLPRPGGWGALGLPTASSEELPIGFTKTIVGVERVAINCAFCHTATYRLAPGPPTGAPGPESDVMTNIVPAGPSQQFRVQAYQKFLWNCA